VAAMDRLGRAHVHAWAVRELAQGQACEGRSTICVGGHGR
jgi:hypothetical protein